MIGRGWIVGLSAALVLTAAASALQARPLDAIKARGHIMVCANPNALPYAAKTGDRPGIQLELAKALADELGVGLEVGWVVLGVQVSRVDCDIVLDSIADKAVQGERRIKLSRPYQQSGVALAFRPGLQPVATWADLRPGMRIGTLSSSMARVYLGQHKIDTIPFAFEDEMVEALGTGDLDVAALSPATIGFYNLTHPEAPVTATMAFESVPDLNWSVAVGMRKADDALIDTVNAALGKLIEDGTVSVIYARYGVEHRLPPNPD
jgi:ABC-type amino acid transport substrate-binding protein